MDNTRARTRRRRRSKRAPYSFEGSTIDTLEVLQRHARVVTMTGEEVVKAKKRKGTTKLASHTRNEIYEDYGTVDDNCDENPLDTLPEDLTADAILNVGKILSQRNTEKRQRHSDAWSKIFEEAVDTYLLWQPSAPEPLKCHNSRACLLVDSNSKAQYIQLPQNNRVIQLIRLGYMTNAPVRPTVAFSFELLKLFHMLKNTGGLSAEAFAKVLRLSLEQLYLLQFPDFDKRFRDTYYRWLRMHQEARKRLDNAIDVTGQPTGKVTGGWTSTKTDSANQCVESIAFNSLSSMCPSCFGCSDVEIREDRPTISIDGNFQQVHAKDVSPIAEAEPEYLFMDPTKAETRNIAANTCASNFKAPQTKAGDALFDAQGLMGVVCRHGNPLFCRNLFTKGEPFGDVLQIIKQVVQNYPTATKWGVTYDVGCALESALTGLAKELDKDFLVVVNKFHVYAHQFSCQVNYHPHRRPGLGDTDGEGIERYWSAAAFLVRQLKTSSAIHRHQSLDAHIEYTSRMMTTELGPTLCGRLWRASKTLRESSWQLDKLKIRKEAILEQIDNQKSYATNRSKQALPPLLQQVRDSAESIEKLMIERNYELEQVHTRLRGHKNSQAVFKKIRRRRPGVEKEIQRYNSLVDALPIGPELKPDKLDYELLQREMRDEVDVSSFLHHFFKLENLGIAASDVPCWVNNSDMRKSIQLHLQVQALREEIGILHAEVLRVVKWSMENLKALIAYANSQHRCAILLVEKIWSGIKVAHGLSSNIDSMYNADFSMEDVKRLKPDLEDVVQRAYSCLFQEQTESDDAEILPEDGGEDIGGNETDIVDEEDEDYISNDAIFELAMLFANDSHEAN